MLINEICGNDPIQIEDYDSNGIRINGHLYTEPVCLNGRQVLIAEKFAVTDLNNEDFIAAINARPEVILVGTGRRHLFLPPKLIAYLAQNGIGLESMNTSAACRTYMILQSEGRQVWAWLWPEDDKDKK